MTNKYQILYNFIILNSGKDGIHTNAATLHERTGVGLRTVYDALKYFEENKIFDVVKYGNGYLILKDITKVSYFDIDDKRYYKARVRRVCDFIKYDNEAANAQAQFSLSFSEEGV